MRLSHAISGPRRNPLGRKVKVGGKWRNVVGVVHDIKYITLAEAPLPYVYMPLGQEYASGMTLHVRAAGKASVLLPILEEVPPPARPA